MPITGKTALSLFGSSQNSPVQNWMEGGTVRIEVLHGTHAAYGRNNENILPKEENFFP